MARLTDARRWLATDLNAKQRDFFNTHLGHELPILVPNAPQKDEKQETMMRLFENFQKCMLRGFTAFQLKMIGCWEKSNAKPTDLTGYHSIHPIYQRSRWSDKDAPPIGNGQSGVYACKNTVVWEALGPSLILASLLLHRIDLWAWFDALLYADWEEIPYNEINDERPKHGSAYLFRNRGYQDFQAGLGAQQSALDDMVGQIVFRIIGPNHRWWNSHVEYFKPVAATMRGPDPNTVIAYVSINSDYIEPLLNPNIKESERLISQFALALTLVHETMHAMGYYASDLRKIDRTEIGEPFYGNEAVSELGWSQQNATFGGTMTQINIRLRDLDLGHEHTFIGPLLGLCLTPWPDHVNFQNGQYRNSGERFRFKESFREGAQRHIWPVSIDFIERIMQREYWDVQVKMYRKNALRPPRRIAVSVPYLKPTEYIYGPDFDDLVQGSFKTTLDKKSVLQNPSDLLTWLHFQTQASKGYSAKLQQALQRQAQNGQGDEELKKFEVDLLSSYIEDLNQATHWYLHDQIKELCVSKFIAVRCHCCLLLSTMESAGTSHYRKVLRDRGSQDFATLAIQQNAGHREPRLWDKTLALLQHIAALDKQEAGKKKHSLGGGEDDEETDDRIKRQRHQT